MEDKFIPIKNEEINKIIHDELIPIQQIFRSYERLSTNSSFHFDGKIFKKCIFKIQDVIEIARRLSGGETNAIS